MPIYAYRCTACGHAKDHLQKMSDPVLVRCPACGADAFVKQLTAAGFQLKGSGWYATDFKGGAAARPDKASGGETDGGEGKEGSKDGAKDAKGGKEEGGKSEPAKVESAKPEPSPKTGETKAPAPPAAGST